MAKETVTVLGVEYEIIRDKGGKDWPILEDADGYTDFTTKKIVLKELKSTPTTWENMPAYESTVLRHEIVHAFLHESGLDSNSDWARNEEIVDWIAIQFPKMLTSFKEVGAQ